MVLLLLLLRLVFELDLLMMGMQLRLLVPLQCELLLLMEGDLVRLGLTVGGGGEGGEVLLLLLLLLGAVGLGREGGRWGRAAV